MTNTPTDCLRCGAGPLRPATRHDMEGIEHVARGLCRKCWQSSARRQYAPLGAGGYRAASGRPALDVLEDAEHLLARATATRLGITPESRRVIAGRLGMTEAALSRAIYRARDARDAAASRHGHTTRCATDTTPGAPPVTTACPRPRRRPHGAAREGVVNVRSVVIIRMRARPRTDTQHDTHPAAG